MGSNISPARSIALFIIMIGLLAAGLSASLAVSGATRLALQVCGGAIALGVLVMIFGALVVAGSNAENAEE